MAVIGDFGGTSNKSFSIDGKITLFVGDDIPDDLMGNNGDVYFKQEGLIYVKRNGTWLTNDPEDIKWIPDPRTNQNRLLYSNGESYDTTEIVYNANSEQPHQMELYREPNEDRGTTSMIVPNIGWINKSDKNNLLHKSGDETKNGNLTISNGHSLYVYGSGIHVRPGNSDSMAIKFGDICWIWADDDRSITPGCKTSLNLGTFGAGNIDPSRAYIKIISEIDPNENSNYNTYATAPTPYSSASSNEIVTAEWVNEKYSQLSTLISNLKTYVDNQNNNLRTYVETNVDEVRENALTFPNISPTKVSNITNNAQPYYPTKNGWILFNWDENSISSGYLKINDVIIGGQNRGGGGDWGNSNHNVLYPVKKGDKIEWTTRSVTCSFIPCF